ncbi:MAG: helix-turn-helix domain-containing protein [Eggerthella lenta]
MLAGSSAFAGRSVVTVFRVEKNANYTVMSNEHLRNRELSFALGCSQMLSLEEWDYSLEGLSRINTRARRPHRHTRARGARLPRAAETARQLRPPGRHQYVVHERAVAGPSLPESDEPALGFPMRLPCAERPALATSN